MKKSLIFLVALLSFTNLSAALADRDDWYKRYDSDHDGRWNYNEFNGWHRGYYRRHLSDDQLRAIYRNNDLDRDGYWQRQEAYRYYRH